MAKRSVALARAEKAASSSKKRAAILRTKLKTETPKVVGYTILGGAAEGAVQASTPDFLQGLGVDPTAILSALFIGYGLLSQKDGELEKAATSIGSGMAAAYISRYTQAQMS